MWGAYTSYSPQQLLLFAKVVFKGHKTQSWNSGMRNMICAYLLASLREGK